MDIQDHHDVPLPRLTPSPLSSEETRYPGELPSNRSQRNSSEIQEWLIARIAEYTELDPEQVDVRLPFVTFGLASTDTVMLSGDLEEWLGRQLSPTLLWEYPDIATLADALAGNSQPESQAHSPALPSHPSAGPIAIIGIGCRFPGASSPAAFWEILRNGCDEIREVPTDRWDIDAFYDPNPQVPGKMASRWGGFLDQIDLFDAQFFKISPREAAHVDPQQRLLLEVAWHALEDAGQVPERLAGSRTGVFVGIASSDYRDKNLTDPACINAYVGTGNALSIAANRLSYFFDLQGPSIALDTACSSSLVAVYMACHSLWRGECSLALAGGVNVILAPELTINFTKAGAMAADGRCKAFDVRADGYVRGEGAGIVVLKPLAQALADNDPIYAVIRGGAINQDGRTNGLMAPNPRSQEAVLRAAYQAAGLTPGQVQYVEAHGTGTLLGDSIEAQALGVVLAEDRAADQPCLIGSVKTNIGHLEAAAGIAGLIKVALALHHRTIPQSLHFHRPNPHIPFEQLPIRVQQQCSSWPGSGPARAGVSSFGFGGTNAHIVLEEAPAAPPAHAAGAPADQRPHVLTLSAQTPQALHDLALAYRQLLTASPTASLADICYTASNRRGHLDHRVALVADTHEVLLAGLDAYLADDPFPGLASGQVVAGQKPKIVFVFPGQGGQWIGMGQALLQDPVFHAALERCDQALRPYVDWSLLAELAADKQHARLDQIDIVQPILFAIQVALAEVWRSWGVEPDAVVGHSMGEVAAAAVAGALSLDDAARIICHRSALLYRVRGQGSMALVELSREQALEAIADVADQLSVAACNGPTLTVLSGATDALEAVLVSLQEQGIFCRRVKADVASHCQQVDPLLDDLASALDGVTPRRAAIPIYSTVTDTVCDGSTFTPSYWVHNLRQPVLFASAVQRLCADDFSIFLEISPHPLLLTAIQQCAGYHDHDIATLPSLERDGDERSTLLRSLGVCYVRGVPILWGRLFPEERHLVGLPAYPWQRQRFWMEARAQAARARRAHPLLGDTLAVAPYPGMRLWELDLAEQSLAYLADHRLQGSAIFPAAAYLEMALAAGQATFGAKPIIVEEVSFLQALALPEDAGHTLQLAVTSTTSDLASFQCFSRPAPGEGDASDWLLHATGSIRTAADPSPDSARQQDLPALQALHPDLIEADEHYQTMARRGLNYGPCFQGVVQVWRADGSALGHVRLPDEIAGEASRYLVHPTLIDACFQVIAHALPVQIRDASADSYVPTGLRSLRFADSRVSSEAWCSVTLTSAPSADAATVSADVRIIAPDGQVVLDIAGLQLQRLSGGRATAGMEGWWYTVMWERQPHLDDAAIQRPAGRRGPWIIFADRGGIGQQLSAWLVEHGESAVLISHGRSYRRKAPNQYCMNPAAPMEFRRVLRDIERDGHQGCYGIVYLWGLEAAETTIASLEQAQWLGCGGVMTLVQTIAQMDWPAPPRLWLGTAVAQAVVGTEPALAVAQTPLWGFGRVIAREHPELRCRLVDLERSPAAARTLWQELWIDDREEQVAWRDGSRYAARLAPAGTSAAEPALGAPPPQVSVPFGARAFQLGITTPGVLDTLELRACERRAPGPGEVEVQVYAAGLNFRDVLNAMGIAIDVVTGPLQFGSECAGTIVRRGPGVEHLHVGDNVVAIAAASFGAFVTTPAISVAPMPPGLSFEEAATIPITFMTAHYALNHLGRMQPGERVLVHAAAGGVGMAAVQLVHYGGGEVFATAGSPEKRAFLESLGVAHTMDSRSLDFADETMARTGGVGVDLVLNSLSGAAISRSLNVLAPYGRFLEIGKRDIYQNMRLELWPFHKNLSYFAIDLNRMARDRSAYFELLLREVMQLVASGAIRPLPMHVFPIDHAAEAFRFMAQARHIGKVVLSLQVPEVTVVVPARDASAFDPERAYLITGGLGSLGLVVAQWMAGHGARHLALLGRSAPSDAAKAAIDELTHMGADIRVVHADVADPESLSAAFAEIERQMPPLAGVIHAAGILEDGLVLNMDMERLQRVLRPKVQGAWNLHTLTRDLPLDFFVLFSSAAALLGSPGQSNYAAGNAFLDGLAHYRRAQGLPAISIDWGAWSQVGLAATTDRGGRLEQRGIGSITPAQGVEILDRLLCRGATQIGVLPFDLPRWRQAYPNVQELPFFSRLAQAGGDESQNRPPHEKQRVRAALLAAEPIERQSLLERYLGELVARIIGLPLAQLDIRLPLSKLGIDSLMAVEFKNRVELDIGITIPVATLLQGPSVAQIAELAMAQLAPAPSLSPVLPPADTDGAPPSVSEGAIASEATLAGDGEHPSIADELESLSDEEVDRMLAALLTTEESLS